MQRASAIARPEGAGSTFEQFLEFVPDAIVGVGREGEIVLVNRQAETLFGYGRDELIGQTVEVLVPERFREAHPGYRSDYFEEPRTRAMGAGVELFAVRKDGTEFPAEISLSSIETEDGIARDGRRSRHQRPGRERAREGAAASSSTGRGGWRASASSPAASPTTSTTSSA